VRERQHPGSVAYGDLALLPQALVRCAASAGGVYEMAQSVGAAGCYANGKSTARHCLAPGLLVWLYAFDRADQVGNLAMAVTRSTFVSQLDNVTLLHDCDRTSRVVLGEDEGGGSEWRRLAATTSEVYVLAS